MKIDNKFAELCNFIENSKDYELLYYAEDDIHNEYALDLEEAKRIISTIESLQKENEELKKQLHEASLTIQEMIEQDIWCPSSCEKLEKLITQQKKFIKYLEDEIYNIEPKGTGINYNCEYDSEEDYIKAMEEKSRLNTLKIILQKHKEITGVSDDKTN